MKKFKSLIILAFAFVLLAGCASNKAAKAEGEFKLNPDVLTGQLDNGMTYYVLKNAYPENRISLRLAVKVGSIAESDKESGVAHL
ncbi:MAG: hypothetical protein IKR64_07760, partial [Treponema sp.]|nr:hypothetical protein [Treponema sp.]